MLSTHILLTYILLIGTEIVYQTTEITRVRLTVHDLLGREVATLVEEEKLPGTFAVQFLGTGLGSGVYVYRLIAGRHTESRKMILLK